MPSYSCPACNTEHEADPPNGEFWTTSSCVEATCPECGVELHLDVQVDITLMASQVNSGSRITTVDDG